jgi:hypothetical protein
MVALLAWALLAAPLAADAQQAGKVYRIGVLLRRLELETTVRDGLRELGWVEPRPRAIRRRHATRHRAQRLLFQHAAHGAAIRHEGLL